MANKSAVLSQKAAPIGAGPTLLLTKSMTEDESDTDSSDDVECPWDGCSRVFDSDVAVKSHHFAAHDERLGSVVVPCANCGEDKRVKKSRVDNHDRHFCNDQCQGEWRSHNWHGENNPTYDRVEVSCSVCGSSKKVTRSVKNGRNRFFCDDNCMGAYYEGVVGEDHPNWKSGPTPYGKGWNEQKREAVRERQGRQCGSCGLEGSENARMLDVHHIQPARSFDDDEARNAMENLVALCRPCHMVFEQMAPLRPQTPYLD